MTTMIPPTAEDFSRLAKISDQYRSELAAAASVPGTSLIVYQRGHGIAAASVLAARNAGAKTMLFVVPRAMKDAWLRDLDQAGCAATAVPAKRGVMGDICRQAADYRDGPDIKTPMAFVATPYGMAEAGHWHDAWRRRKAFDFVAVMDAHGYRNMNSEKNRGLRDVIDRTGNAVLFVGRETRPEQIYNLEQAWGLHAVAVLPRTAPAAASACEAIGMDAD